VRGPRDTGVAKSCDVDHGVRAVAHFAAASSCTTGQIAAWRASVRCFTTCP